MKKSRQVLVVLEGVFHGPALNTNVDPRIPAPIREALKRQLQQYGHPGSFSYQLDPKKIMSVSPVSPGMKVYQRYKTSPWEASWKGEANERDEICESPSFWSRMDKIYEYSFSLYLPKDFPIADTRLAIAQWKQLCEWFGCRPPNPVLAVRYFRGELFVTQRDDAGQKRLYTSQGEMRGRWLDFRFVVKFSQKQNGFFNGWLNGQQIVKYKGVTAYSSSFGYPAHGFFYFKMGLYRDLMKEPMRIYLDEFRKDQL